MIPAIDPRPYRGDAFWRRSAHGLFSVPASSDFTQAGSPTVTDKVGRLVVTGVQGGSMRVLTRTILPTPWTVECAAGVVGLGSASSGFQAGLHLSDGTKYRRFACGCNSNLHMLQLASMTNISTLSANVHALNAGFNLCLYWMRIADDGTNRTHYWSINGRDWNRINSEANTTFLTATQCGMFVFSNGSAVVVKAAFYHFAHYAGAYTQDEP